ncbi:MAG: restriction endonuclease subunit S [Ramlibacter sp.]|nr:restriction endonuclease subunit S [Ramlibacter sp.]
MNAGQLLQHYERIADAPDAIGQLRKFILDLAVRGKLVPQDSKDEPASALLKRIAAAKARRGISQDAFPLTQEQIPFLLPPGWSWSNIGGVCSKTGSGSTPRGGQAAYKDAGIPFLRSQNVYDDGLHLDDVAYIDPATHARMAGTAVLAKDLLLNITGGSIGRCCRVPDVFGEANVSQHVAIIRAAIPELADYLHRLVLSPHFQSFVVDEQTGAGRGGLPKNRMDRIPVALPPLAEQHRIVVKVDELMALCDRLEAARTHREAARDRLAAASLARLNEPHPETFHEDAPFALDALPALTARPDQIKQLRQTFLNLAVRGKLVPQDASEKVAAADEWDGDNALLDLPPGWRYARLESLLAEDTRNGYSRRPDEVADGTPILRISAGTIRRDGVVAEEEYKRISGIDAETRAQYALKSGDLLACRFNGNKSFVGRLTIFQNYLGMRPIYPDKLIRVRVALQLVVPEYLRLAGDSDLVRNQVESLCATTVGNWGISATNLKEVRFPVPPLDEQQRIVAKVDALLAVCDRLQASLGAGEGHCRRLLDALLHKAMVQKTQRSTNATTTA